MRENIEALFILVPCLAGAALYVADRMGRPSGRLLPDAAFWLVCFGALLFACAYGLRVLHRRRFGDRPWQRQGIFTGPVALTLRGAAMTLAGVLQLTWAVFTFRHEGWNVTAAVLLLLGCGSLFLTFYMVWHYLTRDDSPDDEGR